jgi:hypothetical protein
MSKRRSKEQSKADIDLHRVRIVRVSQRDILQYLWGQHEMPNIVCIPKYPLPEGYRILAGHFNYERNTVDFVIYHSSFEPVPEGDPRDPLAQHPYISPTWDMHCIATQEEIVARGNRDEAEINKVAPDKIEELDL